MTAEIAILNKSAVALAADSAVTIGDGASAKIYNTVNKIFEISSVQPLGVMVYGSLSYMGLPLEVLVKQYRRTILRDKKFDHVSECAESFADYLEKRVPYGANNENENIDRIVYDTIQSISTRARHAFLGHLYDVGKFLPSKANGICQKVIGDEINRLTEIDKAECFTPNQLSTIDRKYGAIVDGHIDSCFNWLKITMGTRRSIRRLVRLALHRAELSSLRTGIVVAGFGEKEICPTLSAFEIDGIVNGRLKRSGMDIVDIDRGGPGADVRAFAQREMVERFLQGVDPAYDLYVQNRLEDTMKNFAQIIFQAQGSTEEKAQEKIEKLSSVISKIRDDFVERSDKHKEDEFRHNVLNMVQFMPNQELATLAESLIDLTSLKRRMSAERETVGREIDVAIISKSEGFVWIKRKHYFPPELNPRFFQRHYRNSGTTEREGN